jgi:hypothetical protein
MVQTDTNDYGSDNDQLNQFAARVKFNGTKLYFKNIDGDFYLDTNGDLYNFCSKNKPY